MAADAFDCPDPRLTQQLARQFTLAGLVSSQALTQVSDGSLVQPWSLTPGQQVVVTTDSLIEAVHFPTLTTAFDLAHKALAVNLSDLAAMGATPRAISLSLVLLDVSQPWLEAFVAGCQALMQRYQLVLAQLQVGTGESKSIHLQAFGEVAANQALQRSGARLGDWVCVSGTLGDAALGLQQVLDNRFEPDQTSSAYLVERLMRPSPRVELGQVLRRYANACIDVSDGLLADLGHVCEQSDVGARLDWSAIPRSRAHRDLSVGVLAYETALAGGDDYELCFTLAPEGFDQLQRECANLVSVHKIGEIVQQSGIAVYDEQNQLIQLKQTGYEHFKQP